MKKTGVLTGTLVSGASLMESAAADGGYNSGSGSDYGKCVYSRSYSKCDKVPAERYGITPVPTGCANLSSADILLGSGICTIWIGAAAGDGPVIGDEAVAWKACGAGTIVCAIQKKIANAIGRDEPVEEVNVYKITESKGKYSQGDSVLYPVS